MEQFFKYAIPLALVLALVVGMFAVYAVEPIRMAITNAAEPLHHTVYIERYGDNPDIVTYHQYGTMTTKSGTVLVACEARVDEYDTGNPSYIYLWRSTDGGFSFGEHIVVADCTKNKCSEDENECGKGITGHLYSNPTFVEDASSGRIFIFYSEIIGNPQDHTRVFYTYSDNDGLTWSEGVEITSVFDNDPHARPLHVTGPGHGLQISSGAYAGRLILDVWHSNPSGTTTAEKKYGPSFLYSDDGGATWRVSEYIETEYHIDETRIAELAGGVLVLNGRAKDETRKQAFSTDGGATWSTPTTWTSIGNYQNCDSGFTSQVDEDGTILVTTHMKTGTYVRNTLYAYMSYDNGVTWSEGAQLWSDPDLPWGGTGASDVNRISKDTFGCVHGTKWKNNDLVYQVFNVPYMSGDATTYKPEAQVGNTDYDTFAQAVAAAQPRETVILRADIPTAQDVTLNKEIAIDLNGYALWVTDLNALCATGYKAMYDADTGLWYVVTWQEEEPGDCLIGLIDESFSNGLPAGWTAAADADVAWSYTDGKVTADFVRDDSRATALLTSPAVLSGLRQFTVSYDVTYYKLGSQGWSAMYYRLTNDEGKPLSILLELSDSGELKVSCQSHATAVTNAAASSFSRTAVTVADNVATFRVTAANVVDANGKLTMTFYINGECVGTAEYDISELHLRSLLFIGTPINTGVYGNHRIAYDNVKITTVGGDHSYAGDCDHTCDVCGADRETSAAHTHANACDPTCDVCGEQRPVPDHVYDHARDEQCNECGNIRDVPPYISGDINDDGKINNKDLSLLMRHLNGWSVTIVEDAADVNRDGAVNNKDFSLLLQYVNGWPVELK